VTVPVALVAAVAAIPLLAADRSGSPRDEQPAAGLGRAATGTPPPASPAGSPPASPEPDPPSPPRAELGAPDPAVVQAALEFRPLVRYHRDLPGGAYTNTGNSGGHTYILAFAARAGDNRVDGALLEQIRYTLTGGNDIAGNGGYPAQHELQVTGMLSIVKRIPRIWDQLSGEEQARADTMMKASLIGSAFTTSDQNPFVVAGTQQYTLDGDGNVNRGFNPNYREGMAGSVLVAAAYFSVDEARRILADYDHDDFVAELNTRGLSNAHRTFNWRADNPDSPAPTGAQIEAAVRDWSLWGVPLDDPMRLFADLTAHTYGQTEDKVVECGHDGGRGVPVAGAPGGVAGVIDTGCADLPNQGRPGLLLEFDSSDAGGVRSAAVYAYGGFKPNLFTRTVLIDAGLWDPDPEQAEVYDLVLVGAEDLWYKLDHGYREYHKGQYWETLRIDSEEYGFAFLRSLWEDVYLPYHG
jgi:hypothetical protein